MVTSGIIFSFRMHPVSSRNNWFWSILGFCICIHFRTVHVFHWFPCSGPSRVFPFPPWRPPRKISADNPDFEVSYAVYIWSKAFSLEHRQFLRPYISWKNLRNQTSSHTLLLATDFLREFPPGLRPTSGNQQHDHIFERHGVSLKEYVCIHCSFSNVAGLIFCLQGVGHTTSNILVIYHRRLLNIVGDSTSSVTQHRQPCPQSK
jgi:hypothetical protein